jgi:hypothetical protein
VYMSAVLVFVIYARCLQDLEHQSPISLSVFTSVLHGTVYSVLPLLLHNVQHIKLQLL